MGVIGLYQFEDRVLAGLVAAGGTGDHQFVAVDNLDHLPGALEAAPLVALGIGPSCGEPLRTGQKIHALRPDVPLVFSLEPGRCEEVQREIQLTPLLPDDLACVPTGSMSVLVVELLSAADRCQHRRRYRSLLTASGKGSGGGMGKPSDELNYLDRLMEVAPIGVVTLDRSTCVLSSNARALEILGAEIETALGKAFYDHFDTSSARELSRLMGRVLNSGAEAKTLLERERPDGKKQYLDLNAVQFRSAAGDQRVLLVFQDVTVRLEGDRARSEALRLRDEMLERERKARFESERMATELLHANALLETLFTRAPIGLGFWDRKLRFVRVNQALAEMDGLPVHEHLGRTVADLLPGMDASITSSLAKVLDTGEPLLNQEVAGHTPATPGRLRHWSASYYPIRLGSEVAGVGAVFQEIAERKPE